MGVRNILTKNLGVKDSDIGWKATDNGHMVTIGGNDFMGIGKDQVRDNRSYTSAADLNSAVTDFSSKYDYKFNPEDDPTQREYVSPYATNLDELYQRIMNYDYDPQNDATYKALEDKYTKNGQKAMRDTMGAASTLTGGRLNSHAQVAGQGIYNDHMSELAGYIPELADKGMRELYDKFNMVQGMDKDSYGRFYDERNFDVGIDQWDEEQIRLALQTEKDDARYEKEWDYNVEQDRLNRSDKLRSYNGSNSKTQDYTPEQYSNYIAMKNNYLNGNWDKQELIASLTRDKTLKPMLGDKLYMQLLNDATGYSPDQGPSIEDLIKDEEYRNWQIKNDKLENPDVKEDPSLDRNTKYAAILQDFSKYSAAENVAELKSNPGDYISDLGSPEAYYELLERYEREVDAEEFASEDDDIGPIKKLIQGFIN